MWLLCKVLISLDTADSFYRYYLQFLTIPSMIVMKVFTHEKRLLSLLRFWTSRILCIFFTPRWKGLWDRSKCVYIYIYVYMFVPSSKRNDAREGFFISQNFPFHWFLQGFIACVELYIDICRFSIRHYVVGLSYRWTLMITFGNVSRKFFSRHREKNYVSFSCWTNTLMVLQWIQGRDSAMYYLSDESYITKYISLFIYHHHHGQGQRYSLFPHGSPYPIYHFHIN